MRSWYRKAQRILGHESPALLAAARVLASMLALVSAPIVARAIGADGRGETAAAIAAFNLVPILLAVGVPAEVRRLTAVGMGAAAIHRSRVIIYSIGFIPSAFFAWVLNVTIFSAFETEARYVAFIGILLAPLLMGWQCEIAYLVACGRYRVLAMMIATQPTVYLATVLALWLASLASPATVMMANLLGVVSSCAIGFAIVRGSAKAPPIAAGALLRGGVRFAGAAIAESASNRLDQIIALPVLGAQAAGIYSVAATIASVPLAVGQAAAAVYYTPVARSEGAERFFLKRDGLRLGWIVSVASCVGVAVIAPPLIPIAFGPEFADSSTVLLLSLVGSVAMVVAYVGSSLLGAEGKGGSMTIAQVCSVAVGVGLLIPLGGLYGAHGAAMASSAGFIALLVVCLFALRVSLFNSLPRVADWRNAPRAIFGRAQRDDN